MLKPILLLCLCLPFFARAQSRPFSIQGQSTFYEGKRVALIVGAYPLSFNDCTIEGRDSSTNPFVPVTGGRFGIRGTLRYPHPVYVAAFDASGTSGHNSQRYFIEGGTMQVTLHDLAADHNLAVRFHSKSDAEYRRLRRDYKDLVDTTTGAVADMPRLQRFLKTYIQAHPDSYVALWELVFNTPLAPNDDDLAAIRANADFFSPALKASNTWQALTRNIDKSLTLVVGKRFPELRLEPALSLAATVPAHKYTLLEFWYSHCRPCIAQAPAWKAAWEQVKDSSVALIGISVDSRQHRADWRRAIATYGMDWPQYLDVDGVAAERISVRNFPSNFLLDENGIILKKDITPEEWVALVRQRQ